MIARTELAVMDFNNSMCNKQATTADGSLSYKQVFSCVTQSWVVKKVMKKQNRSYLEPLLRLTLDMTPSKNKNYLPVLFFGQSLIIIPLNKFSAISVAS